LHKLAFTSAQLRFFEVHIFVELHTKSFPWSAVRCLAARAEPGRQRVCRAFPAKTFLAMAIILQFRIRQVANICISDLVQVQ